MALASFNCYFDYGAVLVAVNKYLLNLLDMGRFPRLFPQFLQRPDVTSCYPALDGRFQRGRTDSRGGQVKAVGRPGSRYARPISYGISRCYIGPEGAVKVLTGAVLGAIIRLSESAIWQRKGMGKEAKRKPAKNTKIAARSEPSETEVTAQCQFYIDCSQGHRVEAAFPFS